MNLLELKSKEEWEEFLHRVARETKMSVTLTDEKGKHILHTQGQRCPLCVRIRKRKESLSFIWCQCNTAMLEEAKRSLKTHH